MSQLQRYKSKIKLTEMPHIDYGSDHELFDLEIETFKNMKEFVKYLKDILEGKPKKINMEILYI